MSFPYVPAKQALLLEPGTQRPALIRVRVDLPDRDIAFYDPTGCDPDPVTQRVKAETFFGPVIEVRQEHVVVANERHAPWLTTVPLDTVSVDVSSRYIQAHLLLCLALRDEIRPPRVGTPLWERYFYDGDFSGYFAEGWMIEDVLYTHRHWENAPSEVRRQIVVPDLAPLFPHTVHSPDDRDLQALHIVVSARFSPVLGL